MRPIRLLPPLVALALAAAPAGAQLHERVSLGSGDARVYDLVGAIRVVPASGGEITAEVVREGADAARLTIQSGSLGGRPTLRVVFPGDRVNYARAGEWSRTRLRVRDDGTFGDGSDWRDGREVSIVRSGGLDARATVTLAVPAGRTVAVFIGAGEATVTNVDGNVTVHAHDATVTTSRTSGSLTLDTGSGEVSVTDAKGTLDVDSGSGGVTVRGLTGDRLLVDAGSGRFRAESVNVADARLDLGSGGADLVALQAPSLRIDAGSGDVSVDLRSTSRTLDVDSGSGTVTLRLPGAFGAELDIDAGSGGYRVDFPVMVTRQSRSHLTGRVGDGGGRVRIDAGSGEVRLLRSGGA
jgi:lia operon protein LiaG